MICQHCDAPNDETARHCWACGKPFGFSPAGSAPVQGQPFAPAAEPPEPPVDSPFVSSYTAYTAERDAAYTPNVYEELRNLPAHPEYQKLGGWILALAILNIVAIISNFWLLISEDRGLSVLRDLFSGPFGGAPHVLTALLAANICVFVMSILSAVSVYMVFTRNPRFLFFYQLGAMVNILESILAFYAMHALRTGWFGGISIGFDDVSGLIYSVAGLFWMTSYYCKSLRAEVYMGGDEYIERAIIKMR